MVQIQVDATDVQDLIGREIPNAISQAFIAASNSIDDIAKIVIAEVFETAIERAGNAWPTAYSAQLLDTIGTLPINAQPTFNSLIINVDLDFLGSQEDLEMGYHFHAAMAGGGFVSLPYVGQNLKNDFDKRYNFWVSKILDSGLYDITMDARISMWDSMGKAPQWLILQWGTPYEPVIAPYPIEEEINVQLTGFAVSFVARLVDTAIDQVAATGRVALPVDDIVYEPKAGRFASKLTGRFVKSPYEYN